MINASDVLVLLLLWFVTSLTFLGSLTVESMRSKRNPTYSILSMFIHFTTPFITTYSKKGTGMKFGISRRSVNNHTPTRSKNPEQYDSTNSTRSCILVNNRLLLLHLILHAIDHPRLRIKRPPLFLAKCTLLVLLRDVAGRTATSAETVFEGVTFEMVLGAHVAAVEHGHDELNTETGEAVETPALLGVGQ
jgi:hypothetical protein